MIKSPNKEDCGDCPEWDNKCLEDFRYSCLSLADDVDWEKQIRKSKGLD